MKRVCCSECRQEIDGHDFYMETRQGKICSDCLMRNGPEKKEFVGLFRPRGPKGQKAQPKKRSMPVIVLPLKEAL